MYLLNLLIGCKMKAFRGRGFLMCYNYFRFNMDFGCHLLSRLLWYRKEQRVYWYLYLASPHSYFYL